jgi:predicted phosphodiesterase
MKIAIISDIHGNYDALKAVLKDIKKLKIDKIYCLGDIVNYYYEPHKCINILIKKIN